MIFSITGLPREASRDCIHKLLVHSNKTLNCCTGFPTLGVFEDISPKVTVSDVSMIYSCSVFVSALVFFRSLFSEDCSVFNSMMS